MRDYTVKIREKFVKLTAHSTSIASLIAGIKNSKSRKPEMLPLRGKLNGMWEKDADSREANHRHYHKTLTPAFLNNYLCVGSSIQRGIYFFINRANEKNKYYYIGISDDLSRRLSEHLKNEDFIFYSLAFQSRMGLYLREVLLFYGPNYSNHVPEYKRQSCCAKTNPFDSIAWISSDDIDSSTWEEIETWFVSYHSSYFPCCNVDKVWKEPSQEYKEEYEAVQRILVDLLNTAQ